MHRLRDISIRWKLTLLIMATSGIALLLACAAVFTYELVAYRQTMTNDVATLAEIIGSNSCAAIVFSDDRAAEETLNALSVEQHVVVACIYGRDGSVLAKYQRDKTDQQEFKLPKPQPEGQNMADGYLSMFRPIKFHGETIGTIFIQSDLVELQARLKRYAAIVLAFMMASSLVAFLISARAQSVISRPILRLAETARIVSSEKNYSVRAQERSRDEIGFLVDSFNDMLTQIQERDAALQAAQDSLERRVEQRTEQLRAEIAERKRAEEALMLTQFSVDIAAVATLWIGSDGHILNVNQATCQQLGYTREELLQLTVYDFSPRFTEQTWAEHWKELKSERSITLESQHRDKNGRQYPVEITVNYLEFNGKEYNFAFIRDITEHKRVEAELRTAMENAEAASRAKSEFLANMSHEIRTPMNGVIGMTELALDTELTHEQREYLESVQASAVSLLGVINDILDFSKIESGRFDLDPIDFNLRDALADTLSSLALRAHEKGLELACDIVPDVPDDLIGDERRLSQIIVNLVGNGIKFTEEGEVVVRVEVESRAGGEAVLHFSVSDTGIGIPANKQKAVFDAFSQADGSTTRRYGGTGLGLTISAQLCTMMGGRIWVESEEGKGSTFHFTTRLGVQTQTAGCSIATEPISLQGLSVLVVDDNATNRRILEDMLTNWGMKPTAVASGPTALVAADQACADGTPFGLVILDANMPEMDGFSVAEQIRLRPLMADTTLMMLTSAGQYGDTTRCKDVGMASYLVKPVRQSELLNAIVSCLDAEHPQDLGRSSESGRTTTRTGRPLRILVAEDNPVNQKLTTRILEKRGHMPLVVNDGSEALRAFGSQTFDLILMDVQMPVMGGFDATAAIREQERESGSHIPIIAMTAHAMKGDMERCLEAGMDGYVSKPVKPQELFKTIESLGAGHGAPEENLLVEQIMDIEAAMARVDGDVDLLREIACLFLDSCPELVGQISDAVDRADGKALENAAHTLKGSVGNFGAKPAYEAALSLEMLGRSGDLSKAGEALAVLDGALQDLNNVLSRYSMEEAA
jgi:two-component system, sensor histidine kinase and response regulator